MQMFLASRSILPTPWLTRLLLAGFAGLLVSPAMASVVFFLPVQPKTEIANTRMESDATLGEEPFQRRSIVVNEAEQIDFQDDLIQAMPTASERRIVSHPMGSELGEAGWHENTIGQLPLVESTALPPATTPLVSAEAPEETPEDRLTATIELPEAIPGMATLKPGSRNLVSVLRVTDESPSVLDAETVAVGPSPEPTDFDPWLLLEELDEDGNLVASQMTEALVSTLDSPERRGRPGPGSSPIGDEHPSSNVEKLSTTSKPGPDFLRPAILVAVGVLEQASRRLDAWAEMISLAGRARLASAAPTTHN